jgi:hypothetical protein
MSTPTTDSAPKQSRFAKIATTVISVVFVIAMAMAFLGQKMMMGKKYKVSDKEAVNYSGNATEEDAKKLGDALKADGYLSGKNSVDVLLKKDDKEGTVVSFVGNWDWKDEKVVAAFKQVGEDIAAGGLGKPLTLRLMDDHLNTKNEIKVP